MAKLLITGGCGYIGSHLLRRLQQYAPEHELVVFDNLEIGHKEFLPQGVRLVEGDLREKGPIKALLAEGGFGAVLHLAAYAYAGESCIDPARYFENNLQGGLNLLEAMKAESCGKLVFSSTCAVYGTPEALPITEATPKAPDNPYGQSKLMFEQMMDWYAKLFGLEYVALRYFNAAGAGYDVGEWHEPETHLIPLAIQAGLGRGPQLKVFGTDYDTADGSCVRDYIHVLDLADAHLAALKHLFEQGGQTALNLGTGSGTSVLELIDEVSAQLGQAVPFEKGPRRTGDPAALVASAEKAKELFGWQAQLGLKEILASAIAWEKSRA